MEYKIPLCNRKKEIIAYALVSQEDYETVKAYKWYRREFIYTNITKYYVTSSNKINGKRISLHHFIMGKPPKNRVIDHISGDGLDNRRENLRITTRSANNQNRTIDLNSTSKYRGVSKCSQTANKWVASYSNNYIGKYDTEEEAAVEYDKYVYCVLGADTTPNIMLYEEFILLNIDLSYFIKDKTRELPTNICRYNSKTYYALKKYNNQTFTSKLCDSIEDALVELEIFNTHILKLKDKKELDHNNKQITRDDDGNAIISLYNKKKEFIINVIVDDDKWHKLSNITWNMNSVTKYIETKINKTNIRMHQMVFDEEYDKDNYIIDHINHIRHDNRRINLRLNTLSGNSHNKSKSKNKSSQYKGVNYSKNDKRWRAVIYHENKEYNLGLYGNEHEAAIAYNKKAIDLYGKFANLNLVPETFEIKEDEVVRRPTNQYKGICFNKNKQKYQVLILKEKKRYNIGTFKNIVDAILAYNVAMVELFGENAKLHELPSND